MAQFKGRNCILTWTPIVPLSENVHFKDYQVQVYSSAYNFTQAANGTGFIYEDYVSNPRFDFPFELNQQKFGVEQARFAFQVRGRSIYDSYSPTWAQITCYNKNPTGIANISDTEKPKEVVFSWEKEDEDLQYHLQLYTSAYSATVGSGAGYSQNTYVDLPNFTFTKDDNENLFGTVQYKFGVQVKRKNVYDLESENWRWYQYEDQPPAGILGLTATGGFRTALFGWDKCTAADFSHYIVQTRENTGAYGGTADIQTNSYLKSLSSEGVVGDRIGIDVKAVDILLQEGESATGSAVTIGAEIDASNFYIIPSDSNSNSLETLRVLYDSVLDGSAVNMSAGDWIQYEYPVEYVYNASTLWVNKDFNMYLGYYDNNDSAWKYLAGTTGHDLSGGKLIEYSTEGSAQSNYYTTVRDASGKVRVVWPVSRQSDKLRVFDQDIADVDMYEWKNNVFVLADEIVAGKLQLSQGVIIASSPTADEGVVLDTNGFAMYYNGVKNIYIRNDGYAEFGASGQNQVVIGTGGDVEVGGNAIFGGAITSKNWAATGATAGSIWNLDDGVLQLRDTIAGVTTDFSGDVVDGSLTITGIDETELSVILVGDALYGSGIVTGAEVDTLYTSSLLMSTAANVSGAAFSLEAVGDRTRKIITGPGYGFKAYDAKDEIIHDMPNCVIVSDMIYMGHLIEKEAPSYIDEQTTQWTDTNTIRVEYTTLKNTPLNSYMPVGLTNAKGIKVYIYTQVYIDGTKTQMGSGGEVAFKYSLRYNQNPVSDNFSSYNVLIHTASDADNLLLQSDLGVSDIIPIVWNAGLPYITWYLYSKFSGMRAVSAKYSVTAQITLKGFLV